MIVIPLDSPPVGFRFSPTDEELVNHYLKGKINGRNRSELQVIPEIDVCKCEPWDVPDKSVIRSGDLEWFFFSPTDRKYPNGQRSNRATEAGYWKATGKNRFIKKSKCGGGSSAVIGMKKTLVFHTGRAPKGVRTSWIMHEYRATEAEFQSAVGDQGGYVLYRLFKKTEEKNESCNGDEIERSDLSPTPAKSSPGDTQYEADAFEELGAPLAVTPLNQVSGVSGLQEVDQQLLPYSIENQPSGITRWLANKTDSSSPNKAHGDNCRSHVVPEHEAERGALVDPLLDEFEHLYDPKDELSDFSGFPTINSPIRPYSNHPFSGNTDQKSHMGFYSSDHLQQDSIDEFLNSILSNQDGNPFEEPNVRPMATTEVVHNCCSSEIDTEVVEQGDVGMRDPGWFNMDTSIGYPEINCAFRDNQNVFPYESKMADVYSVDSGAESLQASVNSMKESNSHINAFSNGDDTNGTTAIDLRSRLQQHPTQKVAFQGFANRRIRLQCYDEISAVSITESESSSNEEDNGEVASCNEHDEIPGSLIKLEKLSIHEDNAASSKIEELTPQLRLRTKSNISIIDSDIFKGPIPEVKTSRRDVAVNYAIKVFLIIMIMLMVCTGTLGWKKISNLWSGVGSL